VFLIRILDPDPSVKEVVKKSGNLVNMNTQMGQNLQLFEFLKYWVSYHDELAHF